MQQIVRDKDNMERQIELTIADNIEQLDETERQLAAERKRGIETRAELDAALRQLAAQTAAHDADVRYTGCLHSAMPGPGAVNVVA